MEIYYIYIEGTEDYRVDLAMEIEMENMNDAYKKAQELFPHDFICVQGLLTNKIEWR